MLVQLVSVVVLVGALGLGGRGLALGGRGLALGGRGLALGGRGLALGGLFAQLLVYGPVVHTCM